MEYACLRISVSFINRDLLSSRLATLLNTILFQENNFLNICHFFATDHHQSLELKGIVSLPQTLIF